MRLKESYILAKNRRIEATEKALLLIVTVIPPNSLLYLINYIVSEPLTEGKTIFKLLIKGISRYVFQALI